MATDDHDALIDQYREAFGPPAGARQRVFAQLASNGSATPPATAPGERRRWHWAGVGIALIATAAALALWSRTSTPSTPSTRETADDPNTAVYDRVPADSEGQAVPRTSGSPAPSREPDSNSNPEPIAPLEPPPPAVPPEPVEVATSGADEASPTAGAVARPRRAPKRARPQPTPSLAPSGPEIAALVATLEQVERELSGGRATRARALLRGRRAEFAGAGLQEEYDGYRVLARCASADHERAATLQAEFTARYPRSMYGRRIAAACPAQPSKTTSAP